MVSKRKTFENLSILKEGSVMSRKRNQVWPNQSIPSINQGGLLVPPAAETIVHILSTLFEVDLTDKTIGEIATEVFDIDYSQSEDCLQLAVSTPLDPSEGKEKRTTKIE